MLTASIAVIILLLIYVVPQVTKVFTQMKQDLPALTQSLLALSGWLQDYGLILFVVLLTSVVLFLLLLRNPDYRRRWDHFLLSVPRLGYLLVISNMAGWSRSLGMLLSSGVSTTDALKIASERVGNLDLYHTLEQVSQSVREGESLNKALSKSEAFPPFLVQMVSSGESSGSLDHMLIKVADYYDRRIQAMTSTVLKLFEPMLVIMMGGIVLLIVMAVLVPVIEMNQLI